MHVYDYLCITVCVFLFVCVHVNDFVCDCMFLFCVYICVCVGAFMFTFVFKALKGPDLVFLPPPFLPAVRPDYEFMYSLCVLCVFIWFLMEISPRSAAGHLFLSPGASLFCIFPSSSH